MLKDIREDKFEPAKYKFSFKHQEDSYRFISSYLDDDRFYKAIKKLKIEKSISKTEGTGEHTMCEALDRLINEGEERGIERGTLDTLYRLVNSNTITVDDAAKDMGITKEQFLDKIREAGYEI